MPTTPKQTLTGLVLDEDCLFTLDEISHACSVRAEYIIELVDEGIVEPMGMGQQREQQQWSFSGKSLLRARKARRLQQDLGINLAGAAVVLDMMEEIEQLRERIRRLG
jgi:chaperone modulatory protein CbpM